MYGMGGGGGKLQTLVDFPIDELDLSPMVLHKDSSEQYSYELFGISNHYGGCGGGHYTAFAKNWRDNQWYSLDDSSCSKTTQSRIITDAAYNLFYRRKAKIDLNEISYEHLKQSAHEKDLE